MTPFEARLYIQGVGVYVPHEHRSEVLVLFPSQERAHRRGLRDIHGKPICRHHAVIQFSARCLSELGEISDRVPEPWTTLDVSGLWIGFEAEPVAKLPELSLKNDRRVPGVPYLPALVTKFAQGPPEDFLDKKIWPGENTEAELLKAGLFLHAGALSPYAEYEGLFRFNVGDVRNRKDRKYASVLKLELGQVKSFALRFRRFGSDEIVRLPIQPPWDELEVWVRHFCDLARPDPDQELPEPAEADVDFALNYALLSQLDDVLKNLGKDDLPVPNVSTSWAHGGPIGLEPHKCAGGGSQPYAFNAPFKG